MFIDDEPARAGRNGVARANPVCELTSRVKAVLEQLRSDRFNLDEGDDRGYRRGFNDGTTNAERRLAPLTCPVECGLRELAEAVAVTRPVVTFQFDTSETEI